MQRDSAELKLGDYLKVWELFVGWTADQKLDLPLGRDECLVEKCLPDLEKGHIFRVKNNFHTIMKYSIEYFWIKCDKITESRINTKEKTLLEKIDCRTLLLKSCIMTSYFEPTISDCSAASILYTLWAFPLYNRTFTEPSSKICEESSLQLLYLIIASQIHAIISLSTFMLMKWMFWIQMPTHAQCLV